MVSHAGGGMLRELAALTGLSMQATAALADPYKGPWIHAPGDVFAVLVAAVADGADCWTASPNCWATASTHSVQWPPRPRCGAVSRNASTPPTYWICTQLATLHLSHKQEPGAA